MIHKDKSVNYCKTEDPEKCWHIDAVTMADKDTILTSQSELLALGKLRVLAFLKMNTFSLLNKSVHGISRMCCCNMLN